MTLRLLKRTVLSLSLIVMTLSCSEHRDEKILLADSLSLARPDSAMAIMDSIGQTKDRLSRSERMYYELIRAKVQNRAYVDFTTDSVMLEVADYYDHHGTANERMLAHYLLGCTYRDLKEAPMSLQCYYDAVEAADTLSSDCDYSTLMSIWGQIASILDNQYMPMEELEALNKYQKYALLNGDTLNYIRGIELCVGAYNLMDDTVNILKTNEKAIQTYQKHGYFQQAARVLPSSIYVWLNRQDYAKVHQLQQIYETQSGLFDEYGNIAKGKEHYYYGKGLYYLGIEKFDSAEFFFRKVPSNKFKYDSQRGMLKLYLLIGDQDSIEKYSALLGYASDEYFTGQQAQAMHQAKGMYDYSRNQKLAMKKSEEAHKKNQLIIIMSILSFLIISVLIVLYLYNKKQKKHEMTQLNLRYVNTLSNLRQVQNDLTNLGVEYSELRVQKEQDAHILQERINMYKAKYGRLEEQEKVEVLRQVPIVNNLSNNLKPGNANISVTKKDWQELYVVIKEVLPSFYSNVICGSNLTHQETQVAVLTKLEYNINEIAILLTTTPQRITNARASANKKLFGDNSAKTFTRNLGNL